MDDPSLYSIHSALTDPGGHRDLLVDLPDDLADLRRVPLNVSIHFRRAEEAGVETASRRAEPRMRTAARMLGRIRELADRPLAAPRTPAQRLIGHCRTHTVLMTMLLRERAIPARARAVFAAYWDQAMDTTHWVTEYWSAEAERWILTDADLSDAAMAAGGLRFDAADVPREQLVFAGEAWLLLRSGAAEPLRFGDDPDAYGLDFVRGQLLRDAASLCRVEVGAFDSWGLSAQAHVPNEDELALLDRLAELTTAAVDGPAAPVRELCAATPGLKPPAALSSDAPEGERYMEFVPDIWRPGADV
jgi:hypothetical protein